MTHCRHFIKTFGVVGSISFDASGGTDHCGHVPSELLSHEGSRHHNFVSEIYTADKPLVG